MAVNVSKIPNRKDFDAVREAILEVDNNINEIIEGEGLVSDVNGIAGSVNITGSAVSTNVGTSTITISSSEANDGVLTLQAGTGVSISDPNTFSADQATNRTITITNSAPDQVVVLTDSTNIDFTGTYPNFSADLKSNVTIGGTLTAGNLTTGGTLTATDVVADNGDFSTSLTINGDSVVTELIAKGAITFEGIQEISANTDTWGAETQTWETSTLPDDTTSYTILHQDTSSQADVYNTGGNVIQSIGLDTYGHVGSIGSTNLDERYLAFRTVNVGGTALEADAYNDTLSITSSDGITLTTGNDSFNIAGDDKFKQVSVSGTMLSPDSFDDTLSITSSNGITLTTGDDSFEVVGDDKFKFIVTEDDNETLIPTSFDDFVTFNGSSSISVTKDDTRNFVNISLNISDIRFDDGVLVARGFLYWQEASVPTSADLPTSSTFNFEKGKITINDDSWSLIPPLSGSAITEYYIARYTSRNEGAGTDASRTVTFTDPISATGFEGPVTFNALSEELGANGLTIIDGGRIKTGAVQSLNLNLTGYNAVTNPFTTEGTIFDLENGDLISEEFSVVDGNATFAGAIKATASIADQLASNVVSDAADGAAAKGTTDDLESVITITNTKLYQGTGTFENTNTGFYLDNLGQFSLKDKLSFDGTTLNVVGQITVESGSTISSDTTIDGTAASTINSNASDGAAAKGITDNLTSVVAITSSDIAIVNSGETKTFYNAGTPFYVNNTGNFSLGDKLKYDNSANLLTISGAVTIESVSGLDKSDVGLGNVDNTSTADILNGTSGDFTGDVTGTIDGASATSVKTGSEDGTTAKGETDKLTSVVTLTNTDIAIVNAGETKSYNDAGTPFYVDNAGQFSLGDRLTFSSNTLTVIGQITVQSGSSISSDTTIDGTAASTINSNASNGNTAYGVTTDLVDVVEITSTKIYQGAGNFGLSDTGFYLDDAGQFSLKDKLSFNGTTLTVDGNGTFTGTLNAGDVTITEDEIIIKNSNTGSAPSSKINFTNSTDTLVGLIESGRLIGSTVVDGINIQSETDDLFISSDKNITIRGTAAGTMVDNLDIQSSYTFFGGKLHYVIDDTSIGNGSFQNVCQLNSSVDSPSSKALTIKVEVSYEDNGTPAYYEGIFVAYYAYSTGSTWTLSSLSRVREEGNTDVRASVFSSNIIRLSNSTGDFNTEYACNVTVQGYANEIGDFLEILDIASMTYVL